MYITPRRIGEFFNDLGVRLRDMGWKGMLILSGAVSEYPLPLVIPALGAISYHPAVLRLLQT